VASGGAIAYLKVEKPRFLFLEGSTGAVVAVGVATAALPYASVARADASTACATSSVDRLVSDASASAPGTCSSAASAALGEGAQAPTSQRGSAPRRFLPPLPPPMTLL
jgi:hypothetical protein